MPNFYTAEHKGTVYVVNAPDIKSAHIMAHEYLQRVKRKPVHPYSIKVNKAQVIGYDEARL